MARSNPIPLGFVVTTHRKPRLRQPQVALVHWDNAHQNNFNDNGTYPKFSAGINHLSSGRAKASGTMIEVVTVSIVVLSAVIFVAHAFAAFRMR